MGLHESAYIFIDEMDMLIILYIWSISSSDWSDGSYISGVKKGLGGAVSGQSTLSHRRLFLFFLFLFFYFTNFPSLSSEGFPEYIFAQGRTIFWFKKGCIPNKNTIFYPDACLIEINL